MDDKMKKDIKNLGQLQRAADQESLGGNSVASTLLGNEENLEKLEKLEILQKKFKQVRGGFRAGVVVLIILLLYMFYGLISSYFQKPEVKPEVTPVPTVTSVPVSKDFGEYTFTYTMQEIPKLDISNVGCITFGELREKAQNDEHFSAIDGISIVDLNDASQDDVLLFSYNDLGVEIAKQNRIYDFSIANGVTTTVPQTEFLNGTYLDVDTVTYLQKYSNITLEELEALEPEKKYSAGTTDTEYYTHDMYYADSEFKENGKVYANYDEIKAVNTYTTFDLRVYDNNVDLNELANAIDEVLESYEHTLEATSTEELIGVYTKVGNTISKFTSDFTLTSAVDSNLGYETCDKSESDKHHKITIIIKDHAVGIPLYVEYYELLEEAAEPTPTPEQPADTKQVGGEYTIHYVMQQIPKIDLNTVYKTTIAELKKNAETDELFHRIDLKPYEYIGLPLTNTDYDSNVVYSLQSFYDKALKSPQSYDFSIKEGYLDTPKRERVYLDGACNHVKYVQRYPDDYNGVNAHLAGTEVYNYFEGQEFFCDMGDPDYSEIISVCHYPAELKIYDAVDLQALAESIDNALEAVYTPYQYYVYEDNIVFDDTIEVLSSAISKHTDKFVLTTPETTPRATAGSYIAGEDESCIRIHLIISVHSVDAEGYVDFYDYFE